MHIPIFLPRRYKDDNDNIKVLAGDIGGTKTNLGIFISENNEMKLLKESSYYSAEFNSASVVIQKFLNDNNEDIPDRICLGVAGPVINETVDLTNINWLISANELKQDLRVNEVSLLNDLHANAYGLAGLRKNDFVNISNGNKTTAGNMAIIAPGTGLGEAGLFWDGKNYHPFPTEGGHCDFAPQSETDICVYRFLKKSQQHISWEMLASGMAIYPLYLFLKDTTKMDEPAWLADRIRYETPSLVISEVAQNETADICVETMNLFTRYVARAACNLVLKMKALGGLFISGGIPPKNLGYFQSDFFYQSFVKCDRMEDLVRSVPVNIIMNDKTPLMGAAYYAAFGCHDNN